MKTLITIFSLLIITVCQGQNLKYDTLITTQSYKSYYSKTFLNPVAVTYTLYQGGGESSRIGMYFKNDIHGLPTQTNNDYDHSGYDKGHMANAEDFAYNGTAEEVTFRYYNCVPQTPELNRGDWKHFEILIRKASQSDTLNILCYNEFTGVKTRYLNVPSYCYKFVYNKRLKSIVLAFKYSNVAKPVYTNLVDSLQKFPFLNLITQ